MAPIDAEGLQIVRLLWTLHVKELLQLSVKDVADLERTLGEAGMRLAVLEDEQCVSSLRTNLP